MTVQNPAQALVTTLLFAPIALAATPGSVGSWTANTNTLPQTVAGAASVVANGYVYAMGGQDITSNILDTVYYAPLTPNPTTPPTSSTLPAAATPTTPDTGYGMPPSDRTAYLIAGAGTISLALGFALIRKSSRG